MALLKCSECAKEFSTQAPACPNCGCPRTFTTTSDGPLITAKETKKGIGSKTKVSLVLLGGIIGFFVWVINFGATPEMKEKGIARDAVKSCWDAQGRKSLEPGTQRFVAGMCETMEESYTQKYNNRP